MLDFNSLYESSNKDKLMTMVLDELGMEERNYIESLVRAQGSYEKAMEFLVNNKQAISHSSVDSISGEWLDSFNVDLKKV